MGRLDIVSIVFAGAIGAVLLAIADNLRNANQSTTNTVAYGFVIGAGVQVGVRLIGVS